MKTVITLIIALFSICSYASDSRIAQLLDERENRIADYRLLSDSAITNKVMKYSLLNEKLMGISTLDSSIISSLNNEILAMNDSVAGLNTQMAALRSDINRLQERTVNDLKMILILKVAAAVIIVTVLILIYLLFTRKTKKEEPVTIDTRLKETESINEGYLREIDRLKSKEHYLIEEHENGMKVQQQHYNQLSEKYNALEEEFKQLKLSTVQSGNESSHSGEVSSELKEENEKLSKQVNSLKVQLDDSRAKNQAILRKIDKLISDLSGVNSVS